jgi:hypothetical protein
MFPVLAEAQRLLALVPFADNDLLPIDATACEHPRRPLFGRQQKERHFHPSDLQQRSEHNLLLRRLLDSPT